MRKLRIAHISDLHLCPLDRIPISRTTSYHQDVRDELMDLIRKVNESGAEYLFISGDINHIKTASAYQSRDINYYTEIFRHLKLKTLAIPGNHDLPFSSFSEVEKTPYRNLINSANITDLSNKVLQLTEEIKVIGIPFYPTAHALCLLGQIPQKKTPNEITITLVHLDALPEAIPLPWKIISYADLCAAGPNVDLFLLGHVHLSFAPWTNGNQWISKPWSIGRIAKDYFNKENPLKLNHKPQLSLIDIDPSSPKPISINYIELEHKPFSEVFVEEALKKQIEKSEKVTNYLQTINEQFKDWNPSLMNPDQLKNQLDEEIRLVIEEYLPG